MYTLRFAIVFRQCTAAFPPVRFQASSDIHRLRRTTPQLSVLTVAG